MKEGGAVGDTSRRVGAQSKIINDGQKLMFCFRRLKFFITRRIFKISIYDLEHGAEICAATAGAVNFFLRARYVISPSHAISRSRSFFCAIFHQNLHRGDYSKLNSRLFLIIKM